ncbi:hypothetical protein CALCODRAFT_212463 [Calocera cornea HHB12733]|uniref:Uncharacterized protein n=1 Tax=Calocera cornea HHB12733 TaxID=1353952 RepID=A0A165HAC6_9BASI|nr:hypothetical protein CALCODRAFT_212463 [Calocera cornea HHB12733]
MPARVRACPRSIALPHPTAKTKIKSSKYHPAVMSRPPLRTAGPVPSSDNPAATRPAVSTQHQPSASRSGQPRSRRTRAESGGRSARVCEHRQRAGAFFFSAISIQPARDHAPRWVCVLRGPALSRRLALPFRALFHWVHHDPGSDATHWRYSGSPPAAVLHNDLRARLLPPTMFLASTYRLENCIHASYADFTPVTPRSGCINICCEHTPF